MVAQTNQQTTKYATKKNDTVICLRMGKTYTAKTSPSDFKVTTPENSLLSQQAVKVKKSQYLIPIYS